MTTYNFPEQLKGIKYQEKYKGREVEPDSAYHYMERFKHSKEYRYRGYKIPTAEENKLLMKPLMPDFERFYIPREIMDSTTLNCRDKIVWATVARFGPKGVCINSEMLGGLCGLSNQSIWHTLQKLDKKGLIRVYLVKNLRKDGKTNSSVYFVVPIAPKKRRKSQGFSANFHGKVQVGYLQDKLKNSFYGKSIQWLGAAEYKKDKK